MYTRRESKMVVRVIVMLSVCVELHHSLKLSDSRWPMANGGSSAAPKIEKIDVNLA